MQVIYYKDYEEKKSNKNYSNLKKELEKIEVNLRKKEQIEQGYFYQDISNYRKIKRFADSLGGYRLAVFVYDDYCLLVDFDLKQKLENRDQTSEVLFEQNDEFYINYINENKKEQEIDVIDLNMYQELINVQDNGRNEEICLESKRFNQWLLSGNQNISKIFNVLQNSITQENETYTTYKTIHKIEQNNITIYYKSLVENGVNIVCLLDSSDDFAEIDNISTKDELLKKAVKSYPLEIFLETFDEWNEYIVKNSDGNIALSPEEEDILLEIKSYNSDAKYPFFINGRAGSGKSTILQYLFADYIVKFLSLRQDNDLEYEPLYLTYNDKLKEKAIERVCSIILAKTPNNKKQELNLTEKNTIQRQIEEFFKSFDTKDGYNFIEELLYFNKKDNPFRDKKKVDFEDIKAYLKQLISKKGRKFTNFTPELVWYVIRSYIKGRGIIKNDKLQPLSTQEYKKLSKNLKLIDEKIFEIVYSEFYNTYEKYLSDNNLYDDLDLVFEIYKQKAFGKKYSVIFCDEAQDFTKIEFDFILNLNIFLSDNITFNELQTKNIPIVFAGDPFQTINPTGFNFEYLKALVYESYQNKNQNSALNYKELKFNYRSNDEIIKFSNLIQVLRGVIFRDKNITLQTRWLDNSPEQYSILLFSELIEKEDYYQFIFPVKNVDEYKEDEIFQQLDINRLDVPIDVKGLEYHTVVLYRFGGFYLDNYQNIQEFINNGFKDKESSLPYEYFLNNFYVAITRAKNKIIIIDSQDAKKEFWDKMDTNLLYNKYKELSNLDKENLLTYQDGKSNDLKLNDEDRKVLTKDKLQIDIFERYDDEKDKNILLNDIEKVLKRQKLNPIYHSILEGLKAENNQNYLKTIKHLMKAATKADENKELSKSQISYLVKKSFDNLLKSVTLEDKETLKFLKKYKKDFVKLGLKYEKRVKLLRYFLNQEYSKTLGYLKDEFDIRDKNEILNYIIMVSLNNIENYELEDYIVDLYKGGFIENKELKDIIKNRLDDRDNYHYLIKIFNNIDDIKKQYKDIYCQINLELNPKDVDCLIFNNRVDEVVKLIVNDDVENYQDYYRQILYYLSKNDKDISDILDRLDIELIIGNYLQYYKEFGLNIWGYLINSVLNDIEEKERYVSTLMKFFEKKDIDTKIKHINVVIESLKQQEKPVLNTILFNTFITLFSDLSNKIQMYDIVFALEKTLSFHNEENIKKILGFYNFYLRDKKKKCCKEFIASRFIKIKYEIDKVEKSRFAENFKGDRAMFNDAWLNFIKRRVKYLKVEVTTDIIAKIPLRLEYELLKNIYKVSNVDKIYKRVIQYYQNKRPSANVAETKPADAEETKPANVAEVKADVKDTSSSKEKWNDINKGNIIDILDSVQVFIEGCDDWNRKLLRDISNMLSGIKDDVEAIKNRLK